jgi:hypothetical protein
MIAVAGDGTNAMDVSKNVRAWRCAQCPARLQAFCPGGGLLLLAAWASADVRHVLLQQPHARHPSPILEGLWSRYRLARGAFASCCRSFMFVSLACSGRIRKFLLQLRVCEFRLVTMVRIMCTHSLGRSWISCFATTRWLVVTLDPGKQADEQPLLILVDTTIEGASPSHARQERWYLGSAPYREQHEIISYF